MNLGKKYIKIDKDVIAKRDLEPYSTHQRCVLAVIWYKAEVNNGGHYQFYSNPTGIVWEDAMDGFELMGMAEGKRIIQESAHRFGNRPSFDRTEREDQLDSLDVDFQDLDTRFYTLESEIGIMERIADFMLVDPVPFFFEGEIEMPIYK